MALLCATNISRTVKLKPTGFESQKRHNRHCISFNRRLKLTYGVSGPEQSRKCSRLSFLFATTSILSLSRLLRVLQFLASPPPSSESVWPQELAVWQEVTCVVPSRTCSNRWCIDSDLAGSSPTPPHIRHLIHTLSIFGFIAYSCWEYTMEAPSRPLRIWERVIRGSGFWVAESDSISIGVMAVVREYGDHFVPSKDSDELRTSYHLMAEGQSGPSTPLKSRIIPSKFDVLKAEHLLSIYRSSWRCYRTS